MLFTLLFNPLYFLTQAGTLLTQFVAYSMTTSILAIAIVSVCYLVVALFISLSDYLHDSFTYNPYFMFIGSITLTLGFSGIVLGLLITSYVLADFASYLTTSNTQQQRIPKRCYCSLII